MTRGYSVCEPHPSVPSTKGRSAYIQAGRGGAGNIKRYNSEQLTRGPAASGPASRVEIPSPPPSTKFTAGRGGAGNTFTRNHSQRAMFSFDEELQREEMIKENMIKAPVYHIGRGGAGNAVNEMEPKGGRTGSMSSSGSSISERTRDRLGSVFRTLSRTVSGSSDRSDRSER